MRSMDGEKRVVVADRDAPRVVGVAADAREVVGAAELGVPGVADELAEGALLRLLEAPEGQVPQGVVDARGGEESLADHGGVGRPLQSRPVGSAANGGFRSRQVRVSHRLVVLHGSRPQRVRCADEGVRAAGLFRDEILQEGAKDEG